MGCEDESNTYLSETHMQGANPCLSHRTKIKGVVEINSLDFIIKAAAGFVGFYMVFLAVVVSYVIYQFIKHLLNK